MHRWKSRPGAGWKKGVTNDRFEQNRVLLSDIADMDPDELPDILGTTRNMPAKQYRVGKVHPERPLEFRSQRLDPERVLEFVSSSPLFKEFYSQAEPPSMNDIIPLAPLRQGHLAMLVAAGLCNGAEVKDSKNHGRTLLVKGTVKRISEVASTEETGTHDVTRIIHTHRIRVRMLCVNEARIEEIE